MKCIQKKTWKSAEKKKEKNSSINTHSSGTIELGMDYDGLPPTTTRMLAKTSAEL